ncbi:MAG: glycosyltransferase family 2 protein [Bacteroidetes bacterium]|nr:glycosyltransferase family 2 protein [Bacteroidota bacterium]
MQTLSVVVITYNEERNIGRCIDSVKDIADEIIVLDSFSTDATPEIVQQKGCVLHQRIFRGYGAQKNAAAALVSNDYIFFIDADEFLSDGLKESIHTQKKFGFAFDGYTMNRLNNYCGQWIRHGSWYPDKKLRIINRKKGEWNNALVHESIVMENGATLFHLKGDLLHYAYDSVEEHITKNNSYSELSAQLLFKKGKRSKKFKIILNPFWAFVHSYIFRLGFLDGFNGFIIAINLSHLTFLKYIKLHQLEQESKKVKDVKR